MSEHQPDTSEVIQQEDVPLQTVPVQVEGPVRSQTLPATSWSARHYETDDGEAIKIARRDPRRIRLMLQTFSLNHWIGENQQKARTSVGFIVPGGAFRELYHTEEVWAIVASGGGSDGISVIEEYWTD
jgi:hypothetical protein